MINGDGWIGVDLDGTLARYTEFVSPYFIGEPIPLMVERVKKWLSEGRTVKIFTARVAEEDVVKRAGIKAAINSWCVLHIGRVLEVTCKKDYKMIELWDDSAVQVIPNTGRRADGKG